MMRYTTAQEWRDTAMQRSDGVSAEESERRRDMVVAHHSSEGSEPDADQLADYELYIYGKMDADEYQQYLLFKHRPGS